MTSQAKKNNMKTTMQEAIKEIAELWSSPSDRPTYSQIFKVLEDKLEKEKEQIINDYRNGKVNGYDAINEGASYNVTAEEYYNQTYNQNK